MRFITPLRFVLNDNKLSIVIQSKAKNLLIFPGRTTRHPFTYLNTKTIS